MISTRGWDRWDSNVAEGPKSEAFAHSLLSNFVFAGQGDETNVFEVQIRCWIVPL